MMALVVRGLWRDRLHPDVLVLVDAQIDDHHVSHFKQHVLMDMRGPPVIMKPCAMNEEPQEEIEIALALSD